MTEAARLVRAIRRAMQGRSQHEFPGEQKYQDIGLVAFRVGDIHEFAKRLVAEGVTTKEAA